MIEGFRPTGLEFAAQQPKPDQQPNKRTPQAEEAARTSQKKPASPTRR